MFSRRTELQIIAVLSIVCAIEVAALAEDGQFPQNFFFGAGTSAMQIEGAWNVDGRGPSTWDVWTHEHPEKIADGRNTNDTADSYYFYEDDIKALKSIGMTHYRFSISWTRILPDGTLSSRNPAGIDYYNKLIDCMLREDIVPIATMFHFDLPQTLNNLGGFTNEIIVDYFADYADLLFRLYGDRVKMWLTINEPLAFCLTMYSFNFMTPTVKSVPGIAEYLCGHNVHKAHATAYRLYQKRYLAQFNGSIGMAINTIYFYSDVDDEYATRRALDFQLGWFANPVFGVDGDYPAVMREHIDNSSRHEGLQRSRLPKFTNEWIEQIRGAADFFGLNYYTSRMVELLETPTGPNPSYLRDTMIKQSVKPDWKHSSADYIYAYSPGFGDVLRFIKNEYKNPVVIITENGWGDYGELNDTDRIEYLSDHLHELVRATQNDGCNVIGYVAWSIIDNFELSDGLTSKFGLFSVNFTNPRKQRTPKASSVFMKEIIRTGRIPAV